MAQLWKVRAGGQDDGPLPDEVYNLHFEAYWEGEEEWFGARIEQFRPVKPFPFLARYEDDDVDECIFEDDFNIMRTKKGDRHELRWKEAKPAIEVISVSEERGAAPVKRGRGRPKGSRNKQQAAPAAQPMQNLAKRGRGAASMQRRASSASETPEQRQGEEQQARKVAKTEAPSPALDAVPSPAKQHVHSAAEPAHTEKEVASASNADGAQQQQEPQPSDSTAKVPPHSGAKPAQKQEQEEQQLAEKQAQEKVEQQQQAKQLQEQQSEQKELEQAEKAEQQRDPMQEASQAALTCRSPAPKVLPPTAEVDGTASLKQRSVSMDRVGSLGTPAAGPTLASVPPMSGKQRTPVQHPGSIKQESRQVLMLDQSGQEARAPGPSSKAQNAAAGGTARAGSSAGPRSKPMTFCGESKPALPARNDLLRSASAGSGTPKQQQQQQAQQHLAQPQSQQEQPQQPEQQPPLNVQQQQQQPQQAPQAPVRSPTYSPSGHRGPDAPEAGVGAGGQSLLQKALLRSIMGDTVVQERGAAGGQVAGQEDQPKPALQQQQQAGENGSAGDAGLKDGASLPAAGEQQGKGDKDKGQAGQQQQSSTSRTGPQSTVVGSWMRGKTTKLPPSTVLAPQGRSSRLPLQPKPGLPPPPAPSAPAATPPQQAPGSAGMQDGDQPSVPELQALLPRLTLSNDGIKTMAVKVMEVMKTSGAPAVIRCILDRSEQLRHSKTSVGRLHLLYLIDNTLSKIKRINDDTPEEGHPALKEFLQKLGAAIQQLVSGIATDPVLQHKVGKVLNVWENKKLVNSSILMLAKEAYEGDLEKAGSKAQQMGQQPHAPQQAVQVVGGMLLPVGPPSMTTHATIPDLRNVAVLQDAYMRLRTPSKPDPTNPAQRPLHKPWHGPHKVIIPQPPQAFVDSELTSDAPGNTGVWNLMGPKCNVFVLGNQYGSMGAKERERRANSFATQFPKALEEVYGVLHEFEDGGIDDAFLFVEDAEDIEMANRLPWKAFCEAHNLGTGLSGEGQAEPVVELHAVPLPSFQLPQLPTGVHALASGLLQTAELQLLQQQKQQQQQQQAMLLVHAQRAQAFSTAGPNLAGLQQLQQQQQIEQQQQQQQLPHNLGWGASVQSGLMAQQQPQSMFGQSLLGQNLVTSVHTQQQQLQLPDQLPPGQQQQQQQNLAPASAGLASASAAASAPYLHLTGLALDQMKPPEDAPWRQQLPQEPAGGMEPLACSPLGGDYVEGIQQQASGVDLNADEELFNKDSSRFMDEEEEQIGPPPAPYRESGSEYGNQDEDMEIEQFTEMDRVSQQLAGQQRAALAQPQLPPQQHQPPHQYPHPYQQQQPTAAPPLPPGTAPSYPTTHVYPPYASHLQHPQQHPPPHYGDAAAAYTPSIPPWQQQQQQPQFSFPHQPLEALSQPHLLHLQPHAVTTYPPRHAHAQQPPMPPLPPNEHDIEQQHALVPPLPPMPVDGGTLPPLPQAAYMPGEQSPVPPPPPPPGNSAREAPPPLPPSSPPLHSLYDAAAARARMPGVAAPVKTSIPVGAATTTPHVPPAGLSAAGSSADHATAAARAQEASKTAEQKAIERKERLKSAQIKQMLAKHKDKQPSQQQEGIAGQQQEQVAHTPQGLGQHVPAFHQKEQYTAQQPASQARSAARSSPAPSDLPPHLENHQQQAGKKEDREGRLKEENRLSREDAARGSSSSKGGGERERERARGGEGLGLSGSERERDRVRGDEDRSGREGSSRGRDYNSSSRMPSSELPPAHLKAKRATSSELPPGYSHPSAAPDRSRRGSLAAAETDHILRSQEGSRHSDQLPPPPPLDAAHMHEQGLEHGHSSGNQRSRSPLRPQQKAAASRSRSRSVSGDSRSPPRKTSKHSERHHEKGKHSSKDKSRGKSKGRSSPEGAAEVEREEGEQDLTQGTQPGSPRSHKHKHSKHKHNKHKRHKDKKDSKHRHRKDQEQHSHSPRRLGDQEHQQHQDSEGTRSPHRPERLQSAELEERRVGSIKETCQDRRAQQGDRHARPQQVSSEEGELTGGRGDAVGAGANGGAAKQADSNAGTDAQLQDTRGEAGVELGSDHDDHVLHTDLCKIKAEAKGQKSKKSWGPEKQPDEPQCAGQLSGPAQQQQQQQPRQPSALDVEEGEREGGDGSAGELDESGEAEERPEEREGEKQQQRHEPSTDLPPIAKKKFNIPLEGHRPPNLPLSLLDNRGPRSKQRRDKQPVVWEGQARPQWLEEPSTKQPPQQHQQRFQLSSRMQSRLQPPKRSFHDEEEEEQAEEQGRAPLTLAGSGSAPKSWAERNLMQRGGAEEEGEENDFGGVDRRSGRGGKQRGYNKRQRY